MSEFLKTLLSVSLSGAIVAVILLAIRPLTAKRLSRRWQYYVWLLVVLRLLLPLSPTITITTTIPPAVTSNGAPALLTNRQRSLAQAITWRTTRILPSTAPATRGRPGLLSSCPGGQTGRAAVSPAFSSISRMHRMDTSWPQQVPHLARCRKHSTRLRTEARVTPLSRM